ncbi:hypothetical protein D3C78_1399720 [compost metagenome]
MIVLLEFDGGEELEARIVEAQLIEIDHAQVVADFFVGGGQAGGALQVGLGLAVVAASSVELTEAVFGFGGQAAAEQAAVQRLGFATAEQTIDLGFAQAHFADVVRQALQVGQAGVQLAVVGQVVGEVQGQFLLLSHFAATAR